LVFIELTLRMLGLGYKIRYKLPEKTTADYNIFCIGESTTWGIGAENPTRDNYPKQLETMLGEQFPNKKIRCYFDSSIGQNTSEILLKLPHYIKKYQPQIIIIMTGVNNFWNLDRSNIFVFNKNTAVLKYTLKTLAFLNKFRIWKLIKLLRFYLHLYEEKWNRSADNRIKSFWDEEAYQDKLNKIASTVAEYDISEMVKICRANNISVILCSYPINCKFLRKVHMKIAQEYSLPLLDNCAVFQDIPDIYSYISEDRWHPNRKGYALIAKNISSLIKKYKLIK